MLFPVANYGFWILIGSNKMF